MRGHTSIISYCNTPVLASPGQHPSLLTYDIMTTSCCGDFYVSDLLQIMVNELMLL